MSTPAAAVLTPRLISLEDLNVTNVPGTQNTDTVLGLGPATVTKVPITLLTQLVSATSDANAAAQGVPVGGIYFLSTTSTLHARMT